MISLKQITLAITAALVLAGCQQVNTTGGGAVGADRKQNMSMLVSSQQVMQMSAQAYQQTLQQDRQKGVLLADTDPTTQRVRAIAKRLIPQTAIFRPDAVNWQWEVNVEKSKQLNAYCMAGGKIMFFTGIIEQLKLTDDEIAQIMGHEISHALREHSREQISQAYSQQLAKVGFSLLTGGRYDGYMDAADQIIGVGYTLPNSRTHESEADMMGLELAARAGYNPNAAVSLWQKMAQASTGAPPEFLSTHPSSQTRITDLQAKIPAVMPLYTEAQRNLKSAKNK